MNISRAGRNSYENGPVHASFLPCGLGCNDCANILFNATAKGNAMILEHPKFQLRDLSQRQPRPMAHCQFRQNQVFKRRYCPVNDAAYELRNLMTDRLDLFDYQIEAAKKFVEIEILEDRRR